MRWFALVVAGACLAAGVSWADGDSSGKIVYPRKEGDGFRLHVMNPDGSGDRELPGQTAVLNIFPSWSPDGKRVSFMSAASLAPQQHQVSILNVDGTGLTSLNAPSDRSGLAAWSPDGKQLAFASGNEKPNIYISGADGSGLRKVNPEGKGGFGAFWMPDGKRLGYTTFEPENGAPNGRLVLVNPDGSNEEVIASEGLPLAGPNAISPDGKKLLYLVIDLQAQKASLRCWDFGSKSESFLMDLEVSLQGDHLEALALPAWAPDGKSFLVPIHTEKGTGLFKVSEDGKTRTRLTPEGVDCAAGAWSAAK